MGDLVGRRICGFPLVPRGPRKMITPCPPTDHLTCRKVHKVGGERRVQRSGSRTMPQPTAGSGRRPRNVEPDARVAGGSGLLALSAEQLGLDVDDCQYPDGLVPRVHDEVEAPQVDAVDEDRLEVEEERLVRERVRSWKWSALSPSSPVYSVIRRSMPSVDNPSTAARYVRTSSAVWMS